MPSDLFLSDLLSPSQQLLKMGTVKKFFEATVRIYSQGDSYVISGAAAPLLRNDTAMISVAHRVVAIGYQSVIAAWRVRSESLPVKASVSAGQSDRSTSQNLLWCLRSGGPVSPVGLIDSPIGLKS